MNTHLFEISNDKTTARESFAAHELFELLKLLLTYFAKLNCSVTCVSESRAENKVLDQIKGGRVEIC